MTDPIVSSLLPSLPGYPFLDRFVRPPTNRHTNDDKRIFKPFTRKIPIKNMMGVPNTNRFLKDTESSRD